MMLADEWLGGRNLPRRGGTAHHLRGETLTYALVSYAVRPGTTPPSVVVLLAEGFLCRLGPDATTEH